VLKSKYDYYRAGKLSQISGKKKVMKKTFAECLLVLPKDTTSPNFAEKTFAKSHKISKFTKVFSLESFPLYGR